MSGSIRRGNGLESRKHFVRLFNKLQFPRRSEGTFRQTSIHASKVQRQGDVSVPQHAKFAMGPAVASNMSFKWSDLRIKDVILCWFTELGRGGSLGLVAAF